MCFNRIYCHFLTYCKRGARRRPVLLVVSKEVEVRVPLCGRGWVLHSKPAVKGRTDQSESFCHSVVVLSAAAINVEIVVLFCFHSLI